MQPRPSCTLILDLDERLATDEVRLEIDRCYAHVAQTLVRTHPASEGEPANTARIIAKLGTRHYLDSSVEGADELWDTIMERWVRNELHKVGNNLQIYNLRQKEIGGTRLDFTWIELDFENGALRVRLHLDSESGIAAERFEIVSHIRELLNAGALGENVTAVQAPSDASFAHQEAIAEETAEEKAAAKAAAEEAQREAEEAEAKEAEEKAQEDFLESPALVAADHAEETESLAEVRSELESRYEIPEAAFALDYTEWTIMYADGSARDFDSATAAFLDADTAQDAQ